MGYFEMVKIAGVAIVMAVILGVCGHYVYNYEHNQSVIAKQQQQIEELQAEKDVQKKKNDAFEAFMAKKPVIQRRVVKDEAAEDAAIQSGDVTRVLDAFHRLQPVPSGSPPDGGSGRAKPAPGPAAHP